MKLSKKMEVRSAVYGTPDAFRYSCSTSAPD